MLTFDYETEGIVGNPVFNPPRPVGVSIKEDDQPSWYLAWGHPTNNNCSWEDGVTILKDHMRRHEEWLAHNKAFEAAVSKKWLGVVKRDPLKFHDTQFSLFLTDPYAYTFSLKPSSERLLGWAPDEQDELREWILANVPQAKASDWGAYICLAPGDLVGKYAGDSRRTNAPGDTDRTYALHALLYPKVVEQGMLDAYQREQKLEPILSTSSRKGIRLDVETLEHDIPHYRAAQKLCEDYIFSRLGEFEMSKDAQLAEALDRAGMVTDWVLTPTGRRSTSRKNLDGRVKDPLIMQALAYHGITETCMGTFGGPWLEMARADGRLHAQWNQIRSNPGKTMTGTRTGRMSCKDPNLTNIPNDFEGLEVPVFVQKYFRKLKARTVKPIPHMRQYLLPEVGHVWAKRDFSSQEMRIMAHFAEGKLYDAFHADPATDPHKAVGQIIKEHSGIELIRKYVKITGFGIMYGRGIANLSLALGVSDAEGKAVRDAYFAALPEVKQLTREISHRGRSGGYITTWGGRRYYREPDATGRDLSYKLFNYLIQGSAADQTKEATVEWDATKGKDELLLADVHDEMNISVPEEEVRPGMNRLRLAMDADRFDVPFRSEGYIGHNWADIVKEEEWNS